MKELICIVCPQGCHLKVDEENGCSVTGNSCPRGAEYGKMELTHPTRVVTSTVRCQGGLYPRCPVKTDRAVPKELVFDAMKAGQRGGHPQSGKLTKKRRRGAASPFPTAPTGPNSVFQTPSLRPFLNNSRKTTERSGSIWPNTSSR